MSWLISQYKLNDNLATTDVVDNYGSNNGTLNGGDNTEDISVAGKINTALHFDGSADYVKVDYDVSLFADEMTISFWAKSDKTDYVSQGWVVSMWDYATNKRMWGIDINQINDEWEIKTSSNGTINGAVSTGISVDTSYHHFTFVVNNSTKAWKVYLDGVYQSTITASYSYIDKNSFMTLAGLSGGWFFDGIIDDLRIYSKQLNQSEIDFLYNSGNGTEATEFIFDINNDFRLLETWSFGDVNNDFRMVSTLAYYDINNDFRLTGASLYDINNDFRLIPDNTIKIDINNDFRLNLEPLHNIDNKFNLVSLQTNDINNKFNLVKEPVFTDISNIFNLVDQTLPDINNDFRCQKLEKNDINNDFRLVADWQIAGDAGFQSLGKTYVKIYINSIEQTDANIDSISITKVLNGTHVAAFELGRAYDNTKPDMEAVVEIKYNDWVLYKGYVVDISPTSKPEAIRISCHDKYWKQNKTNKYFFVGHKPQDNKENYYNTIKEGLSSECSFDVDVGNFIPQTINCFGQGESNCITSLIQDAGNFGWFYKEDETKKLWEAGKGDIINIEPQSIGTNVKLHQIIKHQFRETINGLVNKLRVQMGEKTLKRFTNTYNSYWTEVYWIYAYPDWDSSLEQLAKNSNTYYGWDYPEPDAGEKYKDVFRKYRLEILNSELESYSDKYPPEVEIISGYEDYLWTPNGFELDGKILEGFTIDYENETLVFNEPLFLCKKNSIDEINRIKRPIIKLKLWKNKYYTYTTYIGENPETEVSNPLMFFTDKIGTYPETIFGILDLSSLSIQQGATWIDNQDVKHEIISWDDTDFAKDFSNWQLSKTADIKITGSVDITLDAFLFYDIDLSKRIMIDGVIDNPLNITSININGFIVTIGLESFRDFERSINLQSRGE